ncbi:uncharacterized protein MONOS_5141 [Monocercomonoides exilis]|uniref:uncharacterized protein n=1 Tax=Monocercomonoides exilis TaxID=2049356 RepID=UPI003559CB34|nr:hypothetical protein MONOS_5141 [Monocercomonoides exilis]|eukprot:MONOS_5141.1-p1 / transcript=MONOS_5141.1 / gene=MONOS_5141 / organism=Monocercomonoides_exilis_PA203 / gene_product=unspecified product / transcript_product=unspecified product / location=Mono_scaffold00146:82039-83412(-) / protein_length=458 / sequence_SO=supercontig / SO=protein_coding / is_pseudo=false
MLKEVLFLAALSSFVNSVMDSFENIEDNAVVYEENERKIFFVKFGATGQGTSLIDVAGDFSNMDNILIGGTSNGTYEVHVIEADTPLESYCGILNGTVSSFIFRGLKYDGNREMDCEVLVTGVLPSPVNDNLIQYDGMVNISFLNLLFPLNLCDQLHQKDECALISSVSGTSFDKFLTLNHVKFDRAQAVVTQHQSSSSLCDISLLYITAGIAMLHNVELSSNVTEITFAGSPFMFHCSCVYLDEIVANRVVIENGAAIEITSTSLSSEVLVAIDGIWMDNIRSKSGIVAGLYIHSTNYGSFVYFDGSFNCSFVSCVAEQGKAGAVTISLAQATSRLTFPELKYLSFDKSNKRAGNVDTSLFLAVPDIHKFGKNRNAFPFASSYTSSNKGWLMGATCESCEMSDLYEKFIEKNMIHLIVSIVVPIALVCLVALIVVIIISCLLRSEKEKEPKNVECA